MFNAATNTSRSLVSALAALSILASCSGSGDKAKAEALLAEATAAYDARNYAGAITLTDSIKSAYPAEIDVRRQALHLATRATEGLTVQKLQEADSLVAVLGVRGDSLQRLVKFVKNPIEGYYTGASTDPESVGAVNGLQARISPDGDFYIISSLKGKPAKSTSVTVSCNGESASTASVPHDGERNDRSMGAEIITFMGAECDSLGRFINKHRATPMTLTFNGSSSHSMPLPAIQASEIATLYDYATTLRQAKLASIEKERLTRMLDIARSQAAKTYIETPTDEK